MSDAALAWAFAAALLASPDARRLLQPRVGAAAAARLRLAVVEVPRVVASKAVLIAVGPTPELGEWDVARGHRLSLLSATLGLWASTSELRVPSDAPLPYRFVLVVDGVVARESPLHLLEPSAQRAAAFVRWEEEGSTRFRPPERLKLFPTTKSLF